jgi:hypothetical protein
MRDLCVMRDAQMYAITEIRLNHERQKGASEAHGCWVTMQYVVI